MIAALTRLPAPMLFWASIALPVPGLVQPNALGWTFLLSQSAVVALLAKLELDASSTVVTSD